MVKTITSKTKKAWHDRPLTIAGAILGLMLGLIAVGLLAVYQKDTRGDVNRLEITVQDQGEEQRRIRDEQDKRIKKVEDQVQKQTARPRTRAAAKRHGHAPTKPSRPKPSRPKPQPPRPRPLPPVLLPPVTIPPVTTPPVTTKPVKVPKLPL